jgi:hypothetical protein
MSLKYIALFLTAVLAVATGGVSGWTDVEPTCQSEAEAEAEVADTAPAAYTYTAPQQAATEATPVPVPVVSTGQPAAAALAAVPVQAVSVTSASTSSAADQQGYATYHSYAATESMSTVSCSDGSNGMITKGYSTLAGLYPNVCAASFITWNSPQCGTCWTITNPQTSKSVSVTAIDGCGSVPGYSAHFDLAPEAFTALGGTGVADGHLVVTYSQC